MSLFNNTQNNKITVHLQLKIINCIEIDKLFIR
jgi:hypothetical protein